MTDYPADIVKFYLKKTINDFREKVEGGAGIPGKTEILNELNLNLTKLISKSLKPVINATGIVVHTNLGRAPYGKAQLDDVTEVLEGYSNLEFDLENADRGSRYSHVTELLKFLTGAEDVLVVNNNAAAVMLILRAFCKNREVIVSRGELIEIGGSFRMPDIMKASDCKMIEVGTTNKTGIKDYENRITKRTAMLLKVHQSNYVIRGFTHEASLDELVTLGKKSDIPVFYDMGSGLLTRANIGILKDEPDVKSTLAHEIDLVSFSGDKLLGGPQSGIIAGKMDMIKKLKKEPMTRALRVGKTTLALLESVCLSYLDEKKLFENNPVFKMLRASTVELNSKAKILLDLLISKNINCRIVPSNGQTGGGSLPDKTIESYAVGLEFPSASRKDKTTFAEDIFKNLLKGEHPLLGVLRKGTLLFDVLTIPDEQIGEAAEIIVSVYREVCGE
jgi:L-seryl-tRNA(Ser) seleniumtransferase